MIKSFLLFGFIIFSVVGRGQSEKRMEDSITGKEKRLILYREIIPVNSSRQQAFLENLAMLMDLPTLPNGREGLCIRIWVWDKPKSYVVNIIDSNGIKNCSVLQFNSKKPDTVDYIAVNEEWKNLKPISGWEKFFFTLNNSQITLLPSGDVQDSVEGFLTMMAYIEFEIATPGFYRFYEYLEPSYYRYVDKNSNTIYRFLKYLSKEMQVKIYNPAEKLFIDPKYKRDK